MATTITDKISGSTTQAPLGDMALNSASVVKLPFSPNQVAGYSREGSNLLVTLVSGEKVSVNNFFVIDQNGHRNELVLEDANGVLWWGQYDEAAWTGFSFTELGSIDELLLVAPAEEGPSAALLGVLGALGVGGAIAASSGGGGSSGSGPGDTTPPDPATDVSIAPDGSMVNGEGEPGAKVIVRDSNGNTIGNGIVGPDGSFEVVLEEPQTDGGELEVVLEDGSGNQSDPSNVTAPNIDTEAPEAPTGLVISDDGKTIGGKGEPGTTVIVRDAEGNEIGSSIVDEAGDFVVELEPPQTDGGVLDVVLQDEAGNESEPANVTAPVIDTEAPEAPTEVAVADDGTAVTGRGEPGTTAIVRDGDGNELGQAVVDELGDFSVDLTPPLTNGESLDVVLQNEAGNESEPVNVTAPVVDSEAPEAPTEVAVADDGTAVTGRGEPGTTAIVRDSDGNELGQAVVDELGDFSVDLTPPLTNGESLDVVLQNEAGNESEPVNVTAPVVDSDAPEAPTEVAVADDGTAVTGRGEPGTTAIVRDADGNELGQAIVDEEGDFSVDLTPPLTNGESLDVVLQNEAGNESEPVNVTAPVVDSDAPDAPTEVAVADDGTAVTGRGEPGTTAIVRDADGNELGQAVVDELGDFSVDLTPPLTNGESLDVVLQNEAGNESEPVNVTAPMVDTDAPDAPTEVAVADDGTAVTGRGEPGTTAVVRDADGNELGQSIVDEEGDFSVDLTPPLTSGESLDVVLQDAAGNESEPANVIAPIVDPETQVLAFDNVASTSVDLEPVVTARAPVTGTESTLLSIGVQTWTHNFIVGPDVTTDFTFEIDENNALLGLFDSAFATLEVRDAGGNWVVIGDSRESGLLDLLGLFGEEVSITAEGLEAGNYRLTYGASSLASVLQQIDWTANYLDTSLTDFDSVPGDAVEGNLIEDAGPDGQQDSRGPGGLAELQIEEDGSYVAVTDGLEINGKYGTLTINADGSYSYQITSTDPDAVGKVDTFNYKLVHPNGDEAGASLHVQIGSPDATLAWDEEQPGADAMSVVAVDDVGVASVEVGNRTETETNDEFASMAWVVGLGQLVSETSFFSIEEGTVADVAIGVQTGSLLGLGGSLTLTVDKQNEDGSWTTMETLSGSNLLDALGLLPGRSGIALTGQTSGSYRAIFDYNTPLGVVGSLTGELATETTYLTEYVPVGVETLEGNLLDGDTLGSDFTSFSIDNEGTYEIPGYAGVTVAGTYGSLLVHSDGSYTYTPNEDLNAIDNFDVFNYRLTHPNGDISDGTLTVTLEGSGLEPTANFAAASADETVALDDLVENNDSHTDEAEDASPVEVSLHDLLALDSADEISIQSDEAGELVFDVVDEPGTHAADTAGTLDADLDYAAAMPPANPEDELWSQSHGHVI